MMLFLYIQARGSCLEKSLSYIGVECVQGLFKPQENKRFSLFPDDECYFHISEEPCPTPGSVKWVVVSDCSLILL